MADQPTQAAEQAPETPAEPDLVDARWVAPFEAFLPDKTVLVPGETVVQIPRGEAKTSEHWELVGAAPTGKAAKPEKAKTEGDV